MYILFILMLIYTVSFFVSSIVFGGWFDDELLTWLPVNVYAQRYNGDFLLFVRRKLHLTSIIFVATWCSQAPPEVIQLGILDIQPPIFIAARVRSLVYIPLSFFSISSYVLLERAMGSDRQWIFGLVETCPIDDYCWILFVPPFLKLFHQLDPLLLLGVRVLLQRICTVALVDGVAAEALQEVYHEHFLLPAWGFCALLSYTDPTTASANLWTIHPMLRFCWTARSTMSCNRWIQLVAWSPRQLPSCRQ